MPRRDSSRYKREVCSVKVIKCTPDMSQRIWQIERECFSDPWSLSSIERDIENGRVFCAFSDEEIVVFIVFWSVLDECEIASLAVSGEHRRKGAAKALLEYALSFPDKKFFLEVREGNTAARSLYKSYGFTEYGRRKNYYKNPTEDAILYRKC